MKKYIFLIVFVLLVAAVFASFSKQKLVLTNIEYFILTEHSKENIKRALFYFDNVNDISLNDVKTRFLYCDNLIIINENGYKNMSPKNVGYNSPLFISKIEQYLFYARIRNETLAGEESLLCIATYIWTPFGWYNISNYVQGGA
jgi:hypothetical protein